MCSGDNARHEVHFCRQCFKVASTSVHRHSIVMTQLASLRNELEDLRRMVRELLLPPSPPSSSSSSQEDIAEHEKKE